jgi:hypothetical protein
MKSLDRVDPFLLTDKEFVRRADACKKIKQALKAQQLLADRKS